MRDNTTLDKKVMKEVTGNKNIENRLIVGTSALVTSSELATARALGRSSPKNNVTMVKRAVINPRLAVGKRVLSVVTKRAVL